MVLHRTTRWVALTAGLALALPAAAAHAGSAPPAPDPAIVGVPIQRTAAAVSSAADAIDHGNGAQAVGPLTASRRYLLRSYSGATYLIAHPPAAPVEDASANPQTFRKLARGLIRASRRGHQHGWIEARASGGAVGPVFADGVTAVFDVLSSQYGGATAAVGMAPDTKGDLLAKVNTTLDTAIVLRNRLVKTIHAAAPTPPAEDARVRAHASQDDAAPTFDVVMPGLTVLLDDELQQMQ